METFNKVARHRYELAELAHKMNIKHNDREEQVKEQLLKISIQLKEINCKLKEVVSKPTEDDILP